jgi:hypothetical protein
MSALALVISLNVQRRDLTAAQRAIVAAPSLPMFEEAAKARMLSGKSADGEAGGRGKKADDKPSARSVQRVSSRESAGVIFKVGVNAIQQTKALLAEAPDLASQVEACTLSLAAAYEELQERRKQVARKERDLERVAESKEAVSATPRLRHDRRRGGGDHRRQAVTPGGGTAGGAGKQGGFAPTRQQPAQRRGDYEFRNRNVLAAGQRRLLPHPQAAPR